MVQGLASVAQALAVLFTGVVALLGLHFTRRNTDRQLAQARESTKDQLQQARDRQERTEASTQTTLRLTEQGQITERFTRAIEQLGSDKLEIRLGGIYALERIAGDSLAMETSPGRDYATIMEVLTAYVRQNAPRWGASVSPAEGSGGRGGAEGNGGTDERAAAPARSGPSPPTLPPPTSRPAWTFLGA